MTALTDLSIDPAKPGSVARPELGDGVRTWHLLLSRDRARDAGAAVLRPRHFLVYRPVDANLIVIGRVLHDAMELERHLQTTFWD